MLRTTDDDQPSLGMDSRKERKNEKGTGTQFDPQNEELANEYVDI